MQDPSVAASFKERQKLSGIRLKPDSPRLSGVDEFSVDHGAPSWNCQPWYR